MYRDQLEMPTEGKFIFIWSGNGNRSLFSMTLRWQGVNEFGKYLERYDHQGATWRRIPIAEIESKIPLGGVFIVKENASV